MYLELTLDNLTDLPEAFHQLYTEKNGKYHLTGVRGMKTQEDVDYVKSILEKERGEHKDTKKKLETFNTLNLSVEEVQQKLDKIHELEAAAEGKLDESKINEMVEARIKTRMAPLQRDLEKYQKDVAEKDSVIGQYQQKDITRQIHDHVRKAATNSKVVGSAVEDVLMHAERIFEVDERGKVVTKDGVGVTPGVEADVWLSDMQDKRSHWWPQSQGGGATGSGQGGGYANNPFSADHWNLTEQGKLLRENPEKANQMATAAGTKVGGGKPVKK